MRDFPFLRILHSLDIKLGGTTNLNLLPKIGRLRYIELWMIRGLTDLRSISSARTLQYLFLQALRNVEGLPSLARLPVLRRLHLETMKGLNRKIIRFNRVLGERFAFRFRSASTQAISERVRILV